MQVNHEIQLVKSSPLKPDDLVTINQALDTYTLVQRTLAPIECIVSCPTSNLIAVYLSNTNQILLVDTRNQSRRDRFPLKSCDKRFSKQSFIVKDMDFSPDGQRLAVGQTDCIIYIYKLPNFTVNNTSISGSDRSTASQQPTASQTTKPTITGKFVCSSPITCLLWVEFGILFGTQDGKVKLITMTNKTSSGSSDQTSATTTPTTKVIAIYNSPKTVMPLSLAFKSPIVAIGFVDSSLTLVTLPAELLVGESNLLGINTSGSDLIGNRRNSTQSSGVVGSLEHTCPPYCLRIVQHNTLCCAGSDGRISLYNIQSESINNGEKSVFGIKWLQNIDLKEDIVALDYSSMNEILAVATTTRLLFIKYDLESTAWRLQGSSIEASNMLALTSLLWTKEGSYLALGTLDGSLELFRCTWNKHSVSEQLDICHIAKNRVRITDRARNLLATYKTRYDIKRVHLLDNGQSVIVWTTNSLLMSHLGQPALQSEISWQPRDKNIKFCFDLDPAFVLIFNRSSNSRELLVVKLGQDCIVYCVKLDQSSIRKSCISIRRYPSVCTFDSIGVEQKYSSIPGGGIRQRSATDSAKSSSRKSSGVPEIANSTDSALKTEPIPSDSLNERLAFVLDSNSLQVVNLRSASKETITIRHSEQIVWIELSRTSNHLVFKDRRKSLYLVGLSDRSSSDGEGSSINSNQLLLDGCEFAKWLPESDILISQSQHDILIWYNAEEVNQVTKIDSRRYNYTNEPPIIDLSCVPSSSSFKKPYPVIVKIDDEQLYLSNGAQVPLDRIKVKFYTELVGCRLESALEVLKKDEEDYRNNLPLDQLTSKNLNLWTKLGWLAIDRANFDVAIRVFTKLNHSSMVQYIEKCISSSAEEREWRIAVLKGDWDKFERIADTDQIISTYKRLNKWSRLIDYLNRTQQFRQRDIAEQEFRQWLVSEGRHLEAAKLQAKAGDLPGAIELLINEGKRDFDGAVEVFVSELKSPIKSNKAMTTTMEERLFTLAKELKAHLIEQGKFEKAALVSDKIIGCDSEEAIELYLRGGAYEPAKELAKRVAPDRVLAIEDSYGEHLMQLYRSSKLPRRKTMEAVEHFIAAKQDLKALEVSIELKCFDRAYAILTGQQTREHAIDGEKFVHLANQIGEFMCKNGHNEQAIEAFLLGQQYNRVVDLYTNKLGEFKKAFDIALRYLYENNRDRTIEEFMRLAKNLSDPIEVESIYIMLEKPDLAIDMHRQTKNYDRMLELVEQFQPDLLESNLLLLARELESEGCFERAEKYLLRVSSSEWTNVVRMYRLAGKWEDAYRVAQEHCGAAKNDPLLVQLAYWWCKSLVMDKGESIGTAYKLLEGLSMLNLVVEFCCENRNFQLALDLCAAGGEESADCAKLKSSIVRRYATFLEQQGKFEKTEQLLLQDDRVEDAARMYVDNDMHSDAIRVVETKLAKLGTKGLHESNQPTTDDPSISDESNEQQKHRKQLVDLLNNTLVQCADRLADEADMLRSSKSSSSNGGSAFSQRVAWPSSASVPAASMEKLLAAQQMYLRAQRPELAVDLYKERGLWQEAIQVAQRFAPQLLESVEQALDAQVSSDIGPIVASSSSQPSQSSRISSRSSSRSSLMTAIGTQRDRDNSETDSGVSGGQLTMQPAEYLRNKAELLMRNGDLGSTKLALGKFLDSMANGGHGDEATLAQVDDWLAQLERHLRDSIPVNPSASTRGRLNRIVWWSRVLVLADKVVRACSWGQWNLLEAHWLAWRRLRDILCNCMQRFMHELHDSSLSTSSTWVDNSTDDYDDFDHNNNNSNTTTTTTEPSGAWELAEHLERRLLVAHYVTLHGCLVKQLHANLKQSQPQFNDSRSVKLTKVSTSRPAHLQTATMNNDQFDTTRTTSWQQSPPPPPSLAKLERLLRQTSSGHQVAWSGSGNSTYNLQPELVALLSKLSLALLRYTDFLDATNAFYVAGYWLLAAGRRDLARFAWLRLVELVDGGRASAASDSPVGREWQRADVPAQLTLNVNSFADRKSTKVAQHSQPVLLSSQQLNEVRNWLLETLIHQPSGGGDAHSSVRLAPLDQWGAFESSLAARGSGQRALPACLVSGYPVLPGPDQLVLSAPDGGKDLPGLTWSPQCQARLSEWRCLLQLRRRNESVNQYGSTREKQPAASIAGGQKCSLNDVVEFIAKLGGVSPANLPK